MGLLAKTIAEFCSAHGFDRTYWIGYSGGLDSHVLLHVLAQLRSRYPLKLRAIYVNHQLSPHADTWARHCAEVCRQLQIDWLERVVSSPIAAQSVEAVARSYRYEIFAEILAEGDMVLTAHHQDDQAETLLLQMLRGAGPKGLASMPKVKNLAVGLHARPLLDCSREALKAYAEQHNLVWIEDESNANVQFARNYLRKAILPVLKQRWPSVADTLQRVAGNCAEAQAVLEEVAQQDWLTTQGRVKNTISISKLKMLTPNRQRQLLRIWLENLGFLLPTAAKLHQVQRDMLIAAQDKTPCITWEGVELRRFQDDLYAMSPLPAHDSTRIFSWNGSQPLAIPGIGILTAKEGYLTDVTVRFRQGGEKLRLSGHSCHRTLKNLFQEWEVASWLRDRIPLLFVGNRLAAVVGYAVDECFLNRGLDKIIIFA